MLHAVPCENESTNNQESGFYECVALYVFHVSKAVIWQGNVQDDIWHKERAATRFEVFFE